MRAPDFERSTIASTPSDAALAQVACEQLRELAASDRSLSIHPAASTAKAIELPAPAVRLLVELLDHMASGRAVTLIPTHAELTTQQVADMLGVSRPFIVKEIEAFRLPARRVGTRRRVMFGDLVQYKQRVDADRQHALDRMAAIDQELGLL